MAILFFAPSTTRQVERKGFKAWFSKNILGYPLFYTLEIKNAYFSIGPTSEGNEGSSWEDAFDVQDLKEKKDG
jgi:hypothetical protein